MSATLSNSTDQRAKLERLRERLRNEKRGNSGGANRPFGGDNAAYPFWNAQEGDTAVVRFLPDADPDNEFFWVHREVIKLPFNGVTGGDYPTNRPVKVNVPCVRMFGEKCPILEHIRPWWNDDSKRELARTYYAKRSYIFQGFVVASPFTESDLPENPIRRFVVGPMLFQIIEQSLMNPEMDDLPTDYQGGRDFNIRKTRKGDYANYSTSQWSFRTRKLGEAELLAVDQHGLFDLKTYLGRHPEGDELAAIKAMLHDSLNGAPFDHAAYGQYYRPYGNANSADADSDAPSPPATARVADSRVQLDTAASEPPGEPASTPSETANDLMQRIRARGAATLAGTH